MNKIIMTAVMILTFTAAIFAQVDDSKSRAILNKVSEKATSYKNMKFDFTYIMIDKKNKVNDTLKGKIVVSGNKFNLDFMERKIISDGKTVWTYDPDAEEIQIDNVKDDQDAFNPDHPERLGLKAALHQQCTQCHKNNQKECQNNWWVNRTRTDYQSDQSKYNGIKC